MSARRRMRASDEDRDKVTEILREAYAVGRLTREEYDERSVATYAARTWGELDDLTADLPLPLPVAVPPPDEARSRAAARERARSQILWMFVLVLAAAVAERAFPAMAWVASAVFSLVLVTPFLARSIGAQPRRSRRDGMR